MDEQARMRFKLLDSSASTAPSAMVIRPSASITFPKGRQPSMGLRQITSMPNTPVLVSTPESRALAGAGATGWAWGSQMCSGNRPAFAPKPTRISADGRIMSARPRAAVNASKDSEPMRFQAMNRPISVTMPPKTAMARYVPAAPIAPAFSSWATQG